MTRSLRIAFCGEGNHDSKVMPIFITKILSTLTPIQPFDLSIDTQRWNTRKRFPEAMLEMVQKAQFLYHMVVMHVDADSPSELRVRQNKVQPGLAALARVNLQTLSLTWAIPVQSIEAWLLASSTAFTRALTGNTEGVRLLDFPRRPDLLPPAEAKQFFNQSVYQLLANTRRQQRRIQPVYFAEAIAEEIALAELRRLRAFVQFEMEFVRELARLGYVEAPAP